MLAKGNWQLTREWREGGSRGPGLLLLAQPCSVKGFFIWTDEVSCGKGDPGWGGAKVKVARLWWTSNLQWMTPAKTKKKKSVTKFHSFVKKIENFFGVSNVFFEAKVPPIFQLAPQGWNLEACRSEKLSNKPMLTLLKAKEDLWKFKNISPCKNIIFDKNPLKETKILQDIV